MKRLLLFWFCASLLLISCEGKSTTVEESEEAPPVMVEIEEPATPAPLPPIMDRFASLDTVEVELSNGKREVFSYGLPGEIRQGWYRRFRPEGTPEEEAFYQNGKLDGKRILYYANGDTQIVETYRNGLFHGPYRLYYPNENLHQEGQFIENVMTGIWKTYYESGELKEEVTFENNLENGPFIEYYKTGQVSVEGEYLEGDQEHGPLKFYNEEGVHVKTMTCDRGLCRTTWELEEG